MESEEENDSGRLWLKKMIQAKTPPLAETDRHKSTARPETDACRLTNSVLSDRHGWPPTEQCWNVTWSTSHSIRVPGQLLPAPHKRHRSWKTESSSVCISKPTLTSTVTQMNTLLTSSAVHKMEVERAAENIFISITSPTLILPPQQSCVRLIQRLRSRCLCN